MTIKPRITAFGLVLLLLAAVFVALPGGAWGEGGALAQTGAAADVVAPNTVVPPVLTEADYPQIAGVNSRIAVWLTAQLHLWFAAFVLAVPIFVFII